jgi:predicted phosphodiesterase
MRIGVISDLQYTGGCIRKDKIDNIEYLKKNKVDVVLVVGDILKEDDDVGCCFWRNYNYNRFKKDFFSGLDTPVYLCVGNYDLYNDSNKIEKLIRKKYVKNPRNKEDYCYDFVNNNIHFICLGLYPNTLGIEYLKKVLTTDKKTIIFFHYGVGAYDWWNKKEHEIFFDTISDSNVIYICVGHTYITNMIKYNDKISIVSGSGSEPYVIKI